MWSEAFLNKLRMQNFGLVFQKSGGVCYAFYQNLSKHCIVQYLINRLLTFSFFIFSSFLVYFCFFLLVFFNFMLWKWSWKLRLKTNLKNPVETLFTTTQPSGLASIEIFTLKQVLQLLPEGAVRRCSIEKVFVEISQNSQQNNCARVSFLIKLQSSNLQLY